jgi:hypothetical protein
MHGLMKQVPITHDGKKESISCLAVARMLIPCGINDLSMSPFAHTSSRGVAYPGSRAAGVDAAGRLAANGVRWTARFDSSRRLVKDGPRHGVSVSLRTDGA